MMGSLCSSSRGMQQIEQRISSERMSMSSVADNQTYRLHYPKNPPTLS
jgi:hypothetical protein